MLTFSDFCLSLTRLPEIRPKASPPWLLAGPFAPIRRTCQTFHGSMAAAEFRVIFTISTHTRTAGQAQYHHHANFFSCATHPLWKTHHANRNGIRRIGARKLVAHKVTRMLTATSCLTVSATRGTA